ncbi:putative ribonuclease H-like domain-containing protein [Tanacetum coccineum]
MTESPLEDSCFVVPVFSLGDDLIACLNKAMAFLTSVASSSSGILEKFSMEEQTRPFLADLGVLDGQAVQTIIPNTAAFQTEDLDTYDSDCDDISNAKAVLMANISIYGSDIISEVPHSETYLNDMENQSVHAIPDFEQPPAMDFTDNKIYSDSNIISYSQYLQETQQENVQDTHLQAQQDSMILSMIEKMSEQMINHVNNWEKANKEHNSESVTAELERYKERVKTFEQQKLALKEQVNSLEQNLSKQIKEKECLLQTFTVFKSESKEKEDKYMENEIDLEKKIKELDNILFKKAKRIKPTLYDGSVMSAKHVAMPVIDDEETLILEEESRSKMSEKAKDPEVINKNISHKPIDYEKLNRLFEDFEKRFTPQQEMDAEQAFWFRISNPTIEYSNPPPVKVEVPSELPKVSLVNASLKKLKFHLAQFDSVVKKRTTPDARTEGEWGFEHTKAIFNNEIIPFLKSLKDIFNVFDRDLLNEIMEVHTVFNQINTVVQQFSVDKQCLEIAKKELFLENDRLLQQIMYQDVLLTVMNSMSLFSKFVNIDGKRKESFNLEAELLKSQNVFNDLLKSYSQLEKHCISLELSIQLNQEIFQKDESCNNQNALEILEFFENNDLKAQLQDKDSTICKLKDIIKSMREKSKEENVKYDYCEIETKNVELENSVAKLLLKNERLCNEINHVKQVFKEQFDSIKKTRVRTKEQSDSLIDKLNLKSAENEDLKAQIQDKVFVITSLKNDLRKLKGKEIVDIAAQIPSANTIVPGMFKLDLEPLAPRLLKNREVHIKYLKYAQEQADILRGIVKQAKSKQPLDKKLDFACSSKKVKIVESKNANHSEPNHNWGSNATDIPSSSSLVLTVRFENKNIARIMRYGDYQLGNVTISRVYYVKRLGHNLFSVGQFCDADLEVAFRKNTCFIRNLEGVDLLVSGFPRPQCLAKDGLARGIPRLKFQKDHLCSACALGKSKKSSHQPKAEDTNQEKLYLLHMDLCGPMRVASINGKKVYLSDCRRLLKIYLENGTEFVNQTLRRFYENVGISHQTSVARTPQQNGVVERRNRTLVEAARTILLHPKLFINPPSIQQNSYELMQEKKPDLSFFHVFGALCYPTNDNDDLGKLDAKADIGIFVGYAPAKKAFRIYNKRTRKIIETIHVTFDELTTMASKQFSSGPGLHSMTPATSSSGLAPNPIPQQPFQEAATLRDVVLAYSFMSTSIDQDAPSSSTPSTQEQEQSLNISQVFKESPKTPIFRDDPLNESPHEESTSQGSSSNVRQTHTPFEYLGKWTKNHLIENVIDDPSCSVFMRKQLQTDAMWCYFDAFLTSIEPKNFKQAMTEPSWIDAIQEEIHEFQRLEVSELVPCLDKVLLIKLKWIYKVKTDGFDWVLKNKARLVAQGLRQE